MWDGIIVGGGLAGLLAGIRAAERGKRVLMISEGVGSLTYSSGVIDFGNVAQLVRQDKHPYALLGESKVRNGADYFQDHFPDYQGKWREVQTVLTPLGSPRKAGFIPKGLNAQALQGAQQIVLMAPEGMKDFFPEVTKANLERAYPQCVVKVHPFRLDAFESWHTLGKPVTGMDYTKYWRSASGTGALKGVVNSLNQKLLDEARIDSGDPGKLVVVFPGLTSAFSNSIKEVLSTLPFPVVEMTAFPPSTSGHKLYDALKETFGALGGELMVGTGVKQVEIQGKCCHKIIVKSKGKDSEFSARSFVLATGGVFGGGIEVTPEASKELVFGLPLYVPAEWTNAEFLGDQPYARIGIEVDRELRPIDSKLNEVVLENVKVIGRMIAHWDPWVEHCGGGVSLASGWFAGETM